MISIITTIIAVLIIGAVLFALAFILRKKIAVPDGTVTYSDTEDTPGEVLKAKSIPLVGKPDYILKRNGDFIPVEVKMGKTPSSPYKNHIAQLYAYCLLVTEHFEKRPPFGIVRYPDKEVPLEFPEAAEAGLKKTIMEVLQKKQSGKYREHMQQVCKLCRSGNHTGRQL
jgi:CRISPR-associated exonuclease Cas4